MRSEHLHTGEESKRKRHGERDRDKYCMLAIKCSCNCTVFFYFLSQSVYIIFNLLSGPKVTANLQYLGNALQYNVNILPFFTFFYI